jgi:hypothetical protein
MKRRTDLCWLIWSSRLVADMGIPSAYGVDRMTARTKPPDALIQSAFQNFLEPRDYSSRVAEKPLNILSHVSFRTQTGKKILETGPTARQTSEACPPSSFVAPHSWSFRIGESAHLCLLSDLERNPLKAEGSSTFFEVRNLCALLIFAGKQAGQKITLHKRAVIMAANLLWEGGNVACYR